MQVLTASVGFCLGITRAYREMNKRALAEAPFAVAHQNAGGEFDTLSRIERREAGLLADYPGLRELSVVRDVSTLGAGDRLVLGFHGLNKETKESLAARGVDLLDDLICPFIEKLDRVVERKAVLHGGASVRDEHGGIEDYLVGSAGVSRADLSTLRGRLTAPG